LATRNSWTFNKRFFSVHPYPAITGNVRDGGDCSFPEIQANAAMLKKPCSPAMAIDLSKTAFFHGICV
jgi:hypothetical protein